MASLEETTAEEEEVPLEFKDEQEEADFLDKFTKLRESVATERRQSMMPAIGAAPLELYSFMKVNPEMEGSGQMLAKLAGQILGIVRNGVLGASLRPLDGMNGFDWLFKVQFKSGEELEMFYDQLDLQNDQGLIVDTLMVSLPRLDGMLAKGHSEVVAFAASKNAGDDMRTILNDATASADGLIKSSVRPIPADNSFFDGYATVAPAYTHVYVLDFDCEDSMKEFMDSAALAGALGSLAAAEPAPMTFSYTF